MMDNATDDDEAALIDSFFLPGGLFADEDAIDDEDNNNNPNNLPPTIRVGVSGSVPSNPWESNIIMQSPNNTGTALLTKVPLLESSGEVMNSHGLPIAVAATVAATVAASPTLQVLAPDHVATMSQSQQQQQQPPSAMNYCETPYFVNVVPSPADDDDVGGFDDDDDDDYVDCGIVKLDFRREQQHQSQQAPQSLQPTNHSNTKNMTIRPPPGFRESSNGHHHHDSHPNRGINNNDTSNSSNSHDDQVDAGALLQSTMYMRNDCCVMQPEDEEMMMTHKDLDLEFYGPLTNLQNPTIQRPGLLVMRPDQVLVATEGQSIDLGLTTDITNTTSEDYKYCDDNHFGQFLDDDLSPEDGQGGNGQVRLNKLRDNEVDDDYDENEEEEDIEEDDDEDEDEDEEDIEESSIPLDICGNSSTGSNTSSLSTCSDNSDLSSNASDTCQIDESKDEALGYDTDQAHVSQIVGILDGSTSNGEIDGKSASPNPSDVCSGEGLPLSSPNRDHKSQNLIPSLGFTWGRLYAFASVIIDYPIKLLLTSVQMAKSNIQLSRVLSSIKRKCVVISRHIDRIRHAYRRILQWLLELKDVISTLLTQFLTATRKFLATITKALIIVASLLFQVWKYSLIEAVEESSVAICFLIFYFTPNFCSLLMGHINLPHWTPHIMTWMGVFCLCNQAKDGTLYEDDDVSIFRLSGKLTIPATPSPPPENQGEVSEREPRSKDPRSASQDRSSHGPIPRDERACRTILKILRLILPFFSLADGFSSEFGTIMGVSGASRLTTAFMMSLVRKNLVSSPIGWVSWAVQVLLATYYPNWTLLDHVVLVVGLSSIRLIRYLDGQRAQKCRKIN
jgi:hypothetical protein